MLILNTNRLNIRELTLNDAELIFQYSQEQCIKDELPDEVFDSLDFVKELLSGFIINYKEKSYPLVFAVALKAPDILIGHISLSPIEDNKIEIGYAISELFQRKGYAKEIVRPFSEWVIETLAIKELYAVVKTSNASSCHVLEVAGYTLQSEEHKKSFGATHLVKTYIFR
ncbi:MAG: GNAT family N-acetyltransferase [Clostridiales bacterium]|nr:GNAT family N-acetyltransferase [Clostridiales bacterium]